MYIKRVLKKIKYIFRDKNKEKRHSLVGPAHLWEMKRNFQIEFLKSQGLKEKHTMLDIGCGTLRGGIPIIDFLENGHYWGIEVRENVVEEARKELREEKLLHKEPKIVHFEDFDSLVLNEKFDFILAFAVVIHLEDSIARKCFQFVSKHLKENGKFYANVNINENKEGQWQGFPVVFRTLDFYEVMAGGSNLKMRKLDTLKSLGHKSNREMGDQQIMLEFSKV